MNKNQLKPFPFYKSVILFGIPGILYLLGFYYLIPFLKDIGFPLILLFPIVLWIPVLILLPLSIYLYKREERNHSFEDFKLRFRLKKIDGKGWVWVFGGCFFVFFFDFVIGESISSWMASISLLSPPEYFPPLFNPLKEITLPLKSLLNVSLKGNWWFLIIVIPVHTIAMISEEFMWRGYILPKQEQNHGHKSWLINGLLWAYLVHGFMKWNLISFLPSMLITPWIAYKTKNTWVSFLVHAIPNTILWVILLLGIMDMS